MIKFTLTSKIPETSGHYIIKVDGAIQIMYISDKDLQVQKKHPSYLNDIDLWSTEPIIEI